MSANRRWPARSTRPTRARWPRWSTRCSTAARRAAAPATAARGLHRAARRLQLLRPDRRPRVRPRYRAEPINRVVLFGPAHLVPLRGCAVPAPESLAHAARAGRRSTRPAPRQLGRPVWPPSTTGRTRPSTRSRCRCRFVQRVLAAGPGCCRSCRRVRGRHRGAVACWRRGPTNRARWSLCSTDLSHYLDEGRPRRSGRRDRGGDRASWPGADRAAATPAACTRCGGCWPGPGSRAHSARALPLHVGPDGW